MSRQELVEAYVDGTITRRVFVERLVKMGVTVGAALTYAVVLAPQRAGARTDDPSKERKKFLHELEKACRKVDKDPSKAFEDVSDLYEDFPEFADKIKAFPAICVIFKDQPEPKEQPA